MKRIALLALAVCALAAPAAAHATNECKGLMVCVPVTGPWVLTSSAAQVQYDLSCPKNYIVAGLDAELSARGIDVGFIGGMGAPVNPGITTQRDAVFLGRVARGSLATFRPHIGCVPAQGGGQRVPTSVHAFPPAKAIDRQVHEYEATPSRAVTARCPKGEHLTGATHAIALYAVAPPSAAALLHTVHVTQMLHGNAVTLHIRSTRHAVVQLDLLCTVR